jgi:hypothetical protein
VEGGVVVLLIEGLLYERSSAGDEGGGRGFGGEVSGGVERGDLVGSYLGYVRCRWRYRYDWRRRGLPFESLGG